MLRSILCAVLALAPTIALADSTVRVATSQQFVGAVDGRELSRFGIRLRVLAEGAILGSAFGKEVEGKWQWENGYFCRDLYFGSQDLGSNCQLVEVTGSKIRFTSDHGAGDFADFRLR